MKRPQGYETRLEQWKRELSAELERNVTYAEIAEATGLSESTLWKHATHLFKRPDYGTAARICDFFNALSSKTRTPLQYFTEVISDEGQPVAVAAS